MPGKIRASFKTAYFVHDLADAAVRRRIQMLQQGGAEVVLLGFLRGDMAVPEFTGVKTYLLARTADGALAKRAGAVALQILRSPGWRNRLKGCDVILARSLELLTLASAARAATGSKAALVYECLDIHRMMLGEGLASRGLRALERGLLGRSSLLWVSSPAFLDNYFAKLQHLSTPTYLVENKMLTEGEPQPRHAHVRPPAPPWRIGWFGMLRCHRSLSALTDLAARRPDLVQIVLRGRPSLNELPDFETLARTPGVDYGGAYTAEELPDLYGGVHFTWAVDYFEAGQNSDWLLPNRIYEGGAAGAVAIASRTVETGRWLERNGLGLLLDDPAAQIEQALDAMTPQAFAQLASAVDAAPGSLFEAGPQACRDLVASLKAVSL
jgi:hypothetical protein